LAAIYKTGCADSGLVCKKKLLLSSLHHIIIKS